MNIEGKKVLVVGLRRTGVAAARFLAGRGATVTVNDNAAPADFDAERAALENYDIRFVLGEHKFGDFTAADFIVVSPGVPLSIPPFEAARRAGVKIIGELELAARFLSLPIVAVTGTNGKSTVTELTGVMLSNSGMRTFVGGNIGNPLINLADMSGGADVAVVEVSSFQLEATEKFHPRVGLMLNVTPDHLDRYSDMKAYARAKARLWMNMGPDDWAVVNVSDPKSLDTLRGCECRRMGFSIDLQPADQPRGWADGDELIAELNGSIEKISTTKMKITGRHNLENALAATLAARLMGASGQAIAEALETFPGLPHRTQFVREIDGVKYFDDSKGTNVGAVVKSLESFDTPIVLIAGGLDKGGEFEILKPLVKERVKAMVLVGAAAKKIEETLGDSSSVKRASDMNHAVKVAQKIADRGDVVLLSPGCASFDMFRDYVQRGEVFQKAVRELTG